MNKFIAIILITLFAFCGTASAALIDVTLGQTNSGDKFSTGGTLTPNINIANLGNDLALHNSVVVNPSFSSSAFKAPAGSLYGNNYLAVLAGGLSTISLNSGVRTFGFEWGSVDTYNTLKITDSRGVTYTITGSELLSYISTKSGYDSVDISFTDPYATIISAQLSSSKNSFEIANLSEAVSSVPLPSTLPLFALTLAGIFFLAQRRKAS